MKKRTCRYPQCFIINALVSQGLACLLLLLVVLASTQVTAQVPRGEQRVAMARDLSFTVAPPWQLVGERRDWVNELQITNDAGLLVARAVINRENQKTADRARQRLLVTAGPAQREGELFLFQGWPGYRKSSSERLRTRRGEQTDTPYRHHVLAIAAGSVFISVDVKDFSNGGEAASAVSALLDSVVVPEAQDPKASERELGAIRELRFKPWGEVNPIKLPHSSIPDVQRLRDRFKPAVLAVPGWGELEITASASGRNVVIGTNSGYARSTDFGATFTRGVGQTPFSIPTTRGDPSTAYGVTGSFYLSYLGNPSGGGTGANSFNGCTVPVAASRDGGVTWNFRGNARQCSNNVSATSNCFPDQEHIAADARNGGGTILGGRGDQVYAIWREFSSTLAPGSPTTCDGIRTASTGVTLVSRAACSRNGGRTWTVAPAPLSTDPNFDYAKITVGRDGRVYIVSALDKGDGWTDLVVDQFSSCNQGFNHQSGFPHVVGWYQTPGCPIVGLDRCSNMGSPTIAVSPDFGDLVWIGASFPSNANDDRVIVAMSTDAGGNFFGWKEISDSVPGRKFMPWICVTGKHLFASWYDRRPSNGNGTDNSLTDFYLGRMDFEVGKLKVSRNINMSVNADSHCSSGWPNGTRNTSSATSCTIQPQSYGICTNSASPPATAGNCNPAAAAATCPPNFTCVASNNGRPKYGDYSGLGCAGGYAFAAWTTGTAPTAGAPAGVNVWVRPYQADLQGRPFSKWRSQTAVQQYWKGP
jgi:hypothetical protein